MHVHRERIISAQCKQVEIALFLKSQLQTLIARTSLDFVCKPL